jgi:hypothetical protein
MWDAPYSSQGVTGGRYPARVDQSSSVKNDNQKELLEGRPYVGHLIYVFVAIFLSIDVLECSNWVITKYVEVEVVK